jgi:hypothetical protein
MAAGSSEPQWHNTSVLPSIEVRVTLADKAAPPEPPSPIDWWRRIKPKGSSSDLKTHCEWVLQTQFGERLRTIWVSHFRSSAESSGDAGPLIAQFAFRVRRIRYASLSFDLEIAGLEALAKLLGHNFELFQMLTEMFVPQAFVFAFDLQNTGAAEGLQYSYAPAAGVAQVFSAPQALPAGVQPSTVTTVATTATTTASAQDRDHKLQWFWKVANFSLVVPVLLSLLVLWAFVNASDRLGARQLELTKLMLDQQKTVVDAQARRNADMERLTVDLLHQVLLSNRKELSDSK